MRCRERRAGARTPLIRAGTALLGVGTALVVVRDAAYANVSVTVSATQVAVTNIDSGIVTGVQWVSTPTVAGPFAAYASHTFTSEGSRGWLFVEAAFDDGERSRKEALHHRTQLLMPTR